MVSLLLQASDAGGVFEYVPLIRSRTAENYDDVARVFAGNRERIVRLDMSPGSLVVFQDRHSLHRVTLVTGSPRRLILLLAYDTLPHQREGIYSLKEAYERVPAP